MVTGIFTESDPRPIQSISCDVRGSYVICFICHFFLYVLLIPFTKVKIQIDQLQKDSLGKSYEITLISESAILSQKWSIIAAQICLIFWYLQTIVDGFLQTILLCIVGEGPWEGPWLWLLALLTCDR